MTEKLKSALPTNNAAHYPGVVLLIRALLIPSLRHLMACTYNWTLVHVVNMLHKSQRIHGTLASYPIQFAVLFFSPLTVFLLFLLFLSQLRPTIPSDLKRLNQCLCQTTSWQPLATTDIIHLFLLTNLSIHSTGNETSPFANCLSAASCRQIKKKEVINPTLNTQQEELWADVKVAQEKEYQE